jgi:hypothetical protein
LSFKIDRVLNVGSGLLIQGMLWLIFWLGPAFPLFRFDPRWGHNFALPIIFLTVGVAYYSHRLSCQLVAVFTSFVTIPVELAFLPWTFATATISSLLLITVILYVNERSREVELVNPRPRLKAWLKIHLLGIAYIGLAHMPLIFFLVRWFNPGSFTSYLPVEHELSTSVFNLMLLVLIPIALMERYVKQIWKLPVMRLGFIWMMLMIIVPLLSINILGS